MVKSELPPKLMKGRGIPVTGRRRMATPTLKNTWVSSIIIFVLEQKNGWIRFHAAQSIVTFGTLAVASIILGWIPVIGTVFSVIIGITGFILWIVLMVKAYNGERFKLAWAGDIAERMAGVTVATTGYRRPPESPRSAAPPQKKETPPAAGEDIDEKISRKVEEFFERKHAGRVTASAFAIAWSIALLIFFNFFYEYVAYYNASTAGSIVTWTRYTFFTREIAQWLPILNTTLAISIAGHVVIIVHDRYLLRKMVLFIIDIFGLATVLSLLTIFPFDFSVIPGAAAAAATNVGVTVVLILIAVGIGISLLVRLVKMLVDLIRGTTQYR